MSCQYFRENHPDCTNCNRHPILRAQENKSKYVLKNPNRIEVCKIQVDDCVINSNDESKCDFLFLACETDKAFFVELKGRDLTHAIDQIDHSIDVLISQLENFAINARVVLSKAQTPDLRTSKYVKFKSKIKRLGGTFEHKNKVMEESL
jgi:hypothetical protein